MKTSTDKPTVDLQHQTIPTIDFINTPLRQEVIEALRYWKEKKEAPYWSAYMETFLTYVATQVLVLIPGEDDLVEEDVQHIYDQFMKELEALKDEDEAKESVPEDFDHIFHNLSVLPRSSQEKFNNLQEVQRAIQGYRQNKRWLLDLWRRHGFLEYPDH